MYMKIYICKSDNNNNNNNIQQDISINDIIKGFALTILIVFGVLRRVEYLEKSKHLQEQLKELKSEIEVLKVEEKQSHLDSIHEESVQRGDNKYSTLGKVCIHPRCMVLILWNKMIGISLVIGGKNSTTIYNG